MSLLRNIAYATIVISFVVWILTRNKPSKDDNVVKKMAHSIAYVFTSLVESAHAIASEYNSAYTEESTVNDNKSK